ncbi:MAG TPA: GTPase, partial [Burkholderiales bacterium]|nr:GTPase [Burkholderiales bacterium]
MSHRCGTVALVGRPNTGKSSLLNRLVGEKLSIVSARPQTTRHLITGILTRPHCQYVFVDAPGNPPRLKSVLHKALNRRVGEAASQADVVLFVVEALSFGPEDHAALERIPAGQNVVAVVNKVDTVRRRAELIPFLERLSKTRDFAALVPVSAKTGKNLPEL